MRRVIVAAIVIGLGVTAVSALLAHNTVDAGSLAARQAAEGLPVLVNQETGEAYRHAALRPPVFVRYPAVNGLIAGLVVLAVGLLVTAEPDGAAGGRKPERHRTP